MTNVQEYKNTIAKANSIITTKTMYAAGAGLIPFPIVDTIALLGVQLTMIESIANLYHIEFKKQLTKSLILTLVGDVSSWGLIKFIPGLGSLLGGATAAVAGGAATYALGKVFTYHFDQGGTLLNFDPVAARVHFKKEYDAGRIFVEEQDLIAQEESIDTPADIVHLWEEGRRIQVTLNELQEKLDLLLAQQDNPVIPTTFDFTLIEGIGPMSNTALQNAGIVDMTHLSQMKVDELKEILIKADLNLNPSTWPQQAVLAAAGKMEELKKLQDELFSGHRPKEKKKK